MFLDYDLSFLNCVAGSGGIAYEVVLIIYFPRNGAMGPTRKCILKNSIAVHKLLGTVLDDQDAASSKFLFSSAFSFDSDVILVTALISKI